MIIRIVLIGLLLMALFSSPEVFAGCHDYPGQTDLSFNNSVTSLGVSEKRDKSHAVISRQQENRKVSKRCCRQV